MNTQSLVIAQLFATFVFVTMFVVSVVALKKQYHTSTWARINKVTSSEYFFYAIVVVAACAVCFNSSNEVGHFLFAVGDKLVAKDHSFVACTLGVTWVSLYLAAFVYAAGGIFVIISGTFEDFAKRKRHQKSRAYLA